MKQNINCKHIMCPECDKCMLFVFYSSKSDENPPKYEIITKMLLFWGKSGHEKSKIIKQGGS